MHTERQSRMLAGYLGERIKAPLVVDYAMRYGSPSVPAVLTKLKQQGCDRILVLPLYPQYAASTTATALDAVSAAYARMRNEPALRSVRNFHDHPGYIAALAQSRERLLVQNGRPDKLVMSFHGVPKFTSRQRRPLPLRMPGDRAPAREALKLRARPSTRCVSIAVRPRANGSSRIPPKCWRSSAGKKAAAST